MHQNDIQAGEGESQHPSDDFRHGQNGVLPVAPSSPDPIAIVGMSCKFAGGASNPSRLWEMMSEAKDCWAPIPLSRFDGPALYHEDQERIDRHHTKGGYFLEDDPYAFDAHFFNLTAEASSAMDPQLRMLLEGVYEAVEDAGIPLDKLAGSKTSVFSGSFARDYADMLLKDAETLPPSFVTGNGTAMLSNRISHFYDLSGPSVTVDTGCSGSLVALNLAVENIRKGESDMAIVGGSSLVLNPDFHVALSGIGVLGGDGRCYSWDHRWSGYGRGEGVVALVLKRLSDATLAGDFVHAIVRESIANQDGRTGTITSPSMEAQQRLIKECYAQAGLEMGNTGYVEAHMTGTSADVLEAEAIATTLGSARAPGDAVFVGSVKTNVGHTEPVSGLASIVKTSLALKHRSIPANLNFESPNSGIPFDNWNVQVPLTLQPWPTGKALRASVNNFGYGGTNVHVIMEAPPSSSCIGRSVEQESNASLVYIVSAKHQGGTVAASKQFADYIRDCNDRGEPADPFKMAYSLNERRSLFSWRTAVRARSVAELATRLEESDRKPVRAAVKPPRVGFVFSGQGAQWYAMGRELLETYPAFAYSVRRADLILREEYGASWSLHDELLRDEASSRVHDTALSQPITVAIQLGLIDLLRSWNLRPADVVSHSSGEIPAAYAAGVLSFGDALGVVYHRGRLAEKYRTQGRLCGSMVAARLSAEDAAGYVESPALKGKVVVACVNSPVSVTLSGDADAIDSLVATLQEEDVFARRLKVPMAYHSHHMLAMAPEYEAILRDILGEDGKRTPAIPFASPVTGKMTTCIGPEHWSDNLTRPVLFSTVVKSLMATPETAPDIFVEIGAHDTLSGAVRQTLGGKAVPYYACLRRGVDAVETMQDTACALIARGCPLSVAEINRMDSVADKKLVPSLPSYPWNHASRYSAEPRASREHRYKRWPPHELLGTCIPDSNRLTPTWRNHLRIRDIAWLRDHQLESQVVLSGAAYLSMAIEAVRLVKGESSQPLGYRLRLVDIAQGLVIPDTPAGIETHFSIHPCDSRQLDHDGWFRFELYSVASDDTWTLHCAGNVLAETNQAPSQSTEIQSPENFLGYGASTPVTDVDVNTAFKTMQSLGFYYGSEFQTLTKCQTAGDRSVTTFALASCASESNYLLHPSMLDALFQACYAGLCQNETEGVMLLPRYMQSMRIPATFGQSPNEHFHALIQKTSSQPRSIDFSGMAFGTNHSSNAHARLEIDGFRLQRVRQSAANDTDGDGALGICATSSWELDVLHDLPLKIREDLQIQLDDRARQYEMDIRKASLHCIKVACTQLQHESTDDWQWHHKRFFDWMLSVVESQAKDHSTSTVTANATQALLGQVAQQNVAGELTVKLGRQLADIIRGRVEPLELMMEFNLLHRYYQEVPQLRDRAFKQLRRVAELYARKQPGAKVLEIGGGTAGATGHVLQAFDSPRGTGAVNDGALLTSYDFTDVSSGFFPAAKEKLNAWSKKMTFACLDIEQDPLEQGFRGGHYDLIIAAHVLHATKSLRKTLTNVRKLLRSQGKLVLLETTQDNLDAQLIFGCLPGWWLGEEESRQMSPNANLRQWNDELLSAGFGGIDFDVWDCEHEELRSVSLIVATAIEAPSFPRAVTLVGDSCTPKPWLEKVSAAIQSTTNVVSGLQQFKTLEVESDTVYILAIDIQAPYLHNMDQQGWKQLQSLLLNSKGILWLSRGGYVDALRPLWAETQGLLRSARREEQGQRILHLDLDTPDGDGVWTISDDVVKHITHVFRTNFDYRVPISSGMDWEYAMKDSMLYVPRIYPDAARDAAMGGEIGHARVELESFDPSTSGRLTWKVRPGGLVDKPQFAREESGTTTAVNGEEQDLMVEVEAKAFGLTCSDLLTAGGFSKASGCEGHEASGIIKRLGALASSQSGLRIGDRVCGLFEGHLANRSLAHWSRVAKVPDHLLWEEAASIPYAYTTAYIGLRHFGRLQSHETVLIHSASGDVGQAAFAIAQEMGARVLVTCGTDEKRQLLMNRYKIAAECIFSNSDDAFVRGIAKLTGGRGADVVLNSLEGRLLEATWECVATCGRLVHTGPMFDIEAGRMLPMAPFSKGTVFAALDVFQ